MIILRGHHLICLNFFHGEGYDEGFISNLTHVMDRVEEEEILVTPDADDVCRTCRWLKEGRCDFGQASDQEIRDMDERATELLGLFRGNKVRWYVIRKKLPSIFSLWFRLYCADCTWRTACEKDQLFKSLKNDVPGKVK